jgi:hypothetical protein
LLPKGSKMEGKPSPRGSFIAFYRGAYAADHSRGPNRALHFVGTIAGLALLFASVTIIPLWWALAFPVAHAVPGLIGHRLFERNPSIGDLRVLDQTYPGAWFMLANHLSAIQTIAQIFGYRMR